MVQSLRELHSGLFFLNIVITLKYKKQACLVCSKNTDNVNSKMVKTKNVRLQLKSQCSICGNKKSRFVKKQGAKL